MAAGANARTQHENTVSSLCCKAAGLLSLLPVGVSMGLYRLIHDVVIIKPKSCKYVQAYYASDIYIQ